VKPLQGLAQENGGNVPFAVFKSHFKIPVIVNDDFETFCADRNLWFVDWDTSCSSHKWKKRGGKRKQRGGKAG